MIKTLGEITDIVNQIKELDLSDAENFLSDVIDNTQNDAFDLGYDEGYEHGHEGHSENVQNSYEAGYDVGFEDATAAIGAWSDPENHVN